MRTDKNPKRGQIREDGKIFWAYKKGYKNGEYWVSKETFDKLKLKDGINYARWKKQNRNTAILHSRRWRLQNQEKSKTSSANWKRKNPEKISRYNKKRMIENPLAKLSCVIRTAIWKSIKQAGFSKKSKTEQIIGCSFSELQIHLQNKFVNGMNWNNHGKWHIDHIIPVSSATTEQELLKLNHYTNLQPLWAIDNLKKWCKIPKLQPLN